MSNVAERISIRLERVGLSAHAASLAAGLSRSAITDILAGNSQSPRLDTLEKLCGPLRCSIHELVSDEPRPVETRPGRHGGPAFPGTYLAFPKDGPSEGVPVFDGGMSLRAWLTGSALVAMGMWMPPVDFDPAQPGVYSAADLSRPEQAALRARWAVMQADAVLAELAR